MSSALTITDIKRGYKAGDQQKAMAAKAARKAFKLSDRDRMFVLVSAVGSKVWKWSYRHAGKDCTLTIGKWPDVSIVQAHEARIAAEKLVSQGIDPNAHAKAKKQKTLTEQATTFWGVTAEWIDLNRTKWSPYYLKQIERYMGKYVRDTPIGARPIKSLTTADIYHLVRDVARRKKLRDDELRTSAPSLAALLKTWCSGVFRLGVVSGRCDNNPAVGFRLADAVVMPPVKNNKALNASQLQDLFKALQTGGGGRPMRIALQLLMLTATRSVELRAARWTEFDFDNALWSIPLERMKMKRPHLVPLSAQAVVLLKELREITGHTDWLFPNSRHENAPMCATALNASLERLGFSGRGSIGFSPHGCRGTFSTWIHESGKFEPLAIERQLAHVQRNQIAAAYNKAEYLTERTTMLQHWADVLDELRATAH
ncbi:tyrosine-type recombinase/integrase [Paraburkholderia gardini]|uniref:Prophage integrase IntS n=1 Tax=Paraburkholderia gardini TaxID=2823469 RepID=A0ABM8U9T9_9BURK|nr:site-specific integrase [Paraburkholderia gardini]CAG4920441.1 Prophage integrase IntS [Paraburkholderia gardini]